MYIYFFKSFAKLLNETNSPELIPLNFLPIIHKGMPLITF